jgi:hypothetical protein
MKVIVSIEKKTGHRLNPRELIFGTLEQLAAICDREVPAVHESFAQRIARRFSKPFTKILFSS